MTNLDRKSSPLFDSLLAACKRIVPMDGTSPAVSMKETTYVLNGRTYTVHTPGGEFAFWFGVNGPRLFFIIFVKGVTHGDAQEAFSFCFGGAAKVGWQLNYEPIDGGVSIWATCMTDQGKALIAPNSKSTVGAGSIPILAITDYGDFWVTDVAMMVQSWIRTSERRGIMCHEMEPAPL